MDKIFLLSPTCLTGLCAALLILCSLSVHTACTAPETYHKSDYLRQFSALAEYTRKNCATLKKPEIRSVRGMFEALSIDLFEEFRPTLSKKERCEIQSYREIIQACLNQSDSILL